MLILQAFPVASNGSDAMKLVRIFLATLTQAVVKKIHIPDRNKIESSQGTMTGPITCIYLPNLHVQ